MLICRKRQVSASLFPSPHSERLCCANQSMSISHSSCMVIPSPMVGGKSPTQPQRNLLQVPPSLRGRWSSIKVDPLRVIYHPTSVQGRWFCFTLHLYRGDDPTISVATGFSDGACKMMKELIFTGASNRRPDHTQSCTELKTAEKSPFFLAAPLECKAHLRPTSARTVGRTPA